VREYSLAESYLVRGQVQSAITEFEGAILEDPTDPTPFFRLARLHRDDLDDPERSADWFRRALVESSPGPGLRQLLRSELIDVWEVRMGKPGRAIPMLTQIANQEADCDDRSWAIAELARIRALAPSPPIPGPSLPLV